MTQWQGKSQANTLGYKIFVFCIKSLGVVFAYSLLKFVALYYFLFSRKSSRFILSFYRNRLGFGKLKALVFLYKNYDKFGQTLIDKIAVMSNAPVNFSFDFDGEEALHEMVAHKKGGLLLSAHAGNYEAAGHLLKRLNTTINVVMYNGEDEQIKKYMDEVTAHKTFNIIYINNDLSHIYKISDALSRNEIVCLHADRFLPDNKTIACSFLGEEARFPEGPFILALKLKVPVAFVYSFKESAKHYHFYSTPLMYFHTSKGDSTISILKKYVASFEKMVKKYPDQWFNYYDFWKK